MAAVEFVSRIGLLRKRGLSRWPVEVSKNSRNGVKSRNPLSLPVGALIHSDKLAPYLQFNECHKAMAAGSRPYQEARLKKVVVYKPVFAFLTFGKQTSPHF